MGQHNDATYPIALNVQLIVGEINVKVMGCHRVSSGHETCLALSTLFYAMRCHRSYKLRMQLFHYNFNEINYER